MRRLALTLLLPVALAACGTPQERCISRVTRDLQTMDQLIGDSRANLSRGFGYETYTVQRSRWVQCYDREVIRGKDGARRIITVPRMCLDDYTDTEQRPVAIDLGAEQRKLDAMVTKRKDLVARSNAGIDACRVQYPQ